MIVVAGRIFPVTFCLQFDDSFIYLISQCKYHIRCIEPFIFHFFVVCPI